MLINGIEGFELCRDGSSPTFRFGRDGVGCRRVFTVPWGNFAKAVKALRGETKVSADKMYFDRTSPYQFWWQDMSRPFTCVDVSQGDPKGMPRKNDGTIDTTVARSTSLLLDDNDVGVAQNAHIVADFEVAPYAVFEDDATDDPINPSGELDQEWDRYTEWDADFSSQLISIPQGAYKYYNSKQQVNIPVRIPIAEAKITATIYGLPVIPPASLLFNGACNATDFSFYLQPKDGVSYLFFNCPSETLMFLYAKNTKRMTAMGERLYDVSLQFSYRQYGHNTTPYYNPTTKRVKFERICADPSTITTAKADNSAPFRLRNFGYFWTPQIPALT